MTENEFYEAQTFSWIRNMKEAAIEECRKNGNSPKWESRIIKTQTIMRVFEEIQQYRAIGTVEECRKAMEKQKAKKPTYEGDGYADDELVYDTWICPNCGEHYETDYDDYIYCPNCGQAIYLSEVN